MSTDKITTYLGVALGVLHQVGVVGTVPQTKDQWVQTGLSAAMLALGYFCNKPN